MTNEADGINAAKQRFHPFLFLLFPIFSIPSIDKIKIKFYICLLFDNNKNFTYLLLWKK